jgi:carboxymethylenebutenolidase
MNRLGRWLLFAIVFAGTTAAAQTVKSQIVRYPSGNEIVSGYLVTPTTSGKHPAIIAIHEWWGLNDWVKEQANKFAELGYVTLAVDLYRGKSTTDPMAAHELMRGLPQDRGIRDLKAAYSYLSSRPDVEPAKIGVVGWCMGGGYSILLAQNEPKLAACAVNYGALPTEPQDIAKIHAPVLGNFGADDIGIPPKAVHAFADAMKTDGKTVDVKIYDGAGHAFENPNNKTGYRPEAAKEAWNRMVAFFKANLQ